MCITELDFVGNFTLLIPPISLHLFGMRELWLRPLGWETPDYKSSFRFLSNIVLVIKVKSIKRSHLRVNKGISFTNCAETI